MDLTSRDSNGAKESEMLHEGGFSKHLHFYCLNVPDTSTKSQAALRSWNFLFCV
jgi:hypothetical protein